MRCFLSGIASELIFIIQWSYSLIFSSFQTFLYTSLVPIIFDLFNLKRQMSVSLLIHGCEDRSSLPKWIEATKRKPSTTLTSLWMWCFSWSYPLPRTIVGDIIHENVGHDTNSLPSFAVLNFKLLSQFLIFFLSSPTSPFSTYLLARSSNSKEHPCLLRLGPKAQENGGSHLHMLGTHWCTPQLCFTPHLSVSFVLVCSLKLNMRTLFYSCIFVKICIHWLWNEQNYYFLVNMTLSNLR